MKALLFLVLVLKILSARSAETVDQDMCIGEPDDVLHVHPDSCEQMILCRDEKPIETQCPDDMRFNPTELICEFGECENDLENSSTESSEDNICKGEPDNALHVHPDSCEQMILCRDEKPIETQCPPGMRFNPTELICEFGECGDNLENSSNESSEDNICKGEPDDALHVHPDSCEQMILCRDEKPIETQCPPGMRFNPTELICEFGECGDNLENSSNESSEDNICKGEPDDALHVHPDSCEQMILCRDEKPIETQCPPGMRFNPTELICEFGECGDDLENSSNESSEDNICKGEPDDALHVHPDSCEQMILCRDEKPIETQCPPGMRFNPTELICEFGECEDSSEENNICTKNPNLLLHPHPDDCHKVIICQNGNAEESQCPPNMKFVPFLGVCEIGTCDGESTIATTSMSPPQPTTRDPNIEEGIVCPNTERNQFEVSYVASNIECHRYYMCLNSSPILMFCREGLHWNQRIFKCDYPEFVKCSIRDPNDYLPNCDGDKIHVLPHSTDCKRYIFCIGGSRILEECRLNYLWDYILEDCVKKDRARCFDDNNIK